MHAAIWKVAPTPAAIGIVRSVRGSPAAYGLRPGCKTFPGRPGTGRLPILCYHVVFTLPHKIFPVSLYNKELIYALLFECAARTLLQFGRDPRHLGALIGFYGILHTWGGKLWQHLHLHFIVTGGGLNETGQWVEPKYKGKFLFPVCAVSQVFRGKFIEGLKAAYYNGQLILPEGFKHLEDAEDFEGLPVPGRPGMAR
jgi:hypothetical protein